MDANDVRRTWADRSGEFSPEYYAYYGPNETSESLVRLFERVLDPTARILELGCGPGRHLSHLRDHGFENLHGIDINEESFEVMAEAYPDLADEGTFYADAIEHTVTEFEDGYFDVLYSIETLQHIHPDDEWVFEELARVTSEYVVTVENEGDDSQPPSERGVNESEYDFPLYYRDWRAVFTSFGFTEVESKSEDRDTLRVFRRTEQ
ncbi:MULTISPECIES: bifunctional 2-polyprenyl-6-hydroxyphenol methylase/3-demethylubiquinol 3-O-methyltransferase UbiG [Haloferax]|uniref:Methyltransferase domain-containing protein n=2 Tax=Haloferax TaxID=2251 RepID=A0A6G1Z0I3_9EURY|nr:MULTISPECIES: class I SAM-dependent methyltransferase [Haloferax]KAB1187447.1 class I SAM-dependent methyltransferase [Haloferax sp. CBA1149]MRW80099.1 methyltransferase domain-containing protein [Haloferax marinisediminis]